MFTKKQQKELLRIAKETVESFIRTGHAPKLNTVDDVLRERKGAFVTLQKQGKLRGCIGQIVPSEKPLWQVVQDMAIAACCEDSRFEPVSEKELKDLKYEISVLSVPRIIHNWQEMELGKHGVIVRKGIRAGVFLPQVAIESKWTKEEFLRQLCRQKAGLGEECYKDPEVELEVFEAFIIK